jgi:hypothetical protein
MEVPIMIRKQPSHDDVEFFNLRLTKWVLGVLAMLIAVVGKESLVGLILGQTRREISGLVRDEEEAAAPSREAWFPSN